LSQSLLLLNLVECKSEWIMNEMGGLSNFITVDRSHPLMPCPWLFHKYVSLFPLNYLLVIIVEIGRHEEQVRLLLASRHSGGPLVINPRATLLLLFLFYYYYFITCEWMIFIRKLMSHGRNDLSLLQGYYFFKKGKKCSLNVDVFMCIDE